MIYSSLLACLLLLLLLLCSAAHYCSTACTRLSEAQDPAADLCDGIQDRTDRNTINASVCTQTAAEASQACAAPRVFHDIYVAMLYTRARPFLPYSSSNFCFALANSASSSAPSSMERTRAARAGRRSRARPRPSRASRKSSTSIASAASRPPEPKRRALAGGDTAGRGSGRRRIRLLRRADFGSGRGRGRGRGARPARRGWRRASSAPVAGLGVDLDHLHEVEAVHGARLRLRNCADLTSPSGVVAHQVARGAAVLGVHLEAGLEGLSPRHRRRSVASLSESLRAL